MTFSENIKSVIFAATCCAMISACGTTTKRTMPASFHDRALTEATQNAISSYGEEYTQNPDRSYALLGLARNLRNAGRANESLEFLKGADRKFGNLAAYQAELGKTYLTLGDLNRAQKHLDRSIAINIDNWDAYAARGIVYDRKEKYSKANASYQQAYALCPDSASILNNMAISSGLTGDIKTSKKLLQKAVSLRPYSRHIKNNLILVSRINENCVACSKESIASDMATVITGQDWSYGDLACSIDSAQIIETLSHADYIDVRVEFEFDSAVLMPKARATIDAIGFALASAELNNESFILEGHTDAVGTDAYNQTLSEKRAKAVKEYLERVIGLDPAHLDTVGYGETQLLEPEHPTDGINRRVRIRRVK